MALTPQELRELAADFLEDYLTNRDIEFIDVAEFVYEASEDELTNDEVIEVHNLASKALHTLVVPDIQ